MFPGGVQGPTSGLSQQSGEAEGSLTLEVQGRAASGPDNDGTAWDCQTGRVRQARQTGATRVNQWLNPRKRETGSNLVDMGRGAARAESSEDDATSMPGTQIGWEATLNACGVGVAMLPGQSWAPILSTGTW